MENPEVTPYAGVPLTLIPKSVIIHWENYKIDNIAPEKRIRIRFLLRKWGFLPPSKYRKRGILSPEQIRIEKNKKSLEYIRRKREKEEKLIELYRANCTAPIGGTV
jgi:hypothetical protein